MRLDPDAARRRFGAAPVARLATVSPAGRPHLVPVTFALDSDGDRVYTAVDAKPKTTTQLQRLRNIRAHPQVALLADHYAADWTQLWWVRADGEATVLEATVLVGGALEGGVLEGGALEGGTAALAGPLRLLAARYPQYAAQPPAGPVIAIRVDRWSGWAAAAR